MNPKESLEVTTEILLALRKESNALRLITEKLRVKEMGPADHIRTKHEAKAFVESGSIQAAETLLHQAQIRIKESQAVANRMTEQQKRGQRLIE